MRSFLSNLFLAGTLLGVLAGCSVMHPGVTPVDVVGDDGMAGPPSVRIDESQIPSFSDVQSTVLLPHPMHSSRPLGPAECACLAASHSKVADVLEKEAANSQSEVSQHRRQGPSRLLPGILSDQAGKQRNDAAEQALLAYYQLAEVHLQNAVLSESYAELKSVEQTVIGLLQAGVDVDMDRSELRRQRSQLDQRNTQLLVSEARLATSVKTLIGDDPFSPERIETTCDIKPRLPGYELHEALEIAHENDAELRSMRRILRSHDVKDLDLARTLLKAASPLLGQKPGRLGLLIKLKVLFGRDERGLQELTVRQRQIRELYDAREKQLDLEVADALITIQQRFLDVGIARDVLDSWAGRINVLESHREAQKSAYSDLIQAKMERLKAKSELQHQLIELEMAHVKLRAVLGLLERECATDSRYPEGTQWAPVSDACRS
jgi:hypothetical protein